MERQPPIIHTLAYGFRRAAPQPARTFLILDLNKVHREQAVLLDRLHVLEDREVAEDAL